MKKTLPINRKSNSFASNDLPIQFSQSVDNKSTGQIEFLLQTALRLSDLDRFHYLGIKISEALELIAKNAKN
jgi:hypothetical protein